MFKKVVLASAVATSMAAPEFRVAPEGRGIAGQYIVRLRNTENLEALKAHVDNIKTALGSEAENLEVFNNLASHGFVGYSVTLSKRAVDFLLNRSEVFSIEEDQIVTIDTCVSQSKPDWGLARINERNYTSTGTYTYDYTSGATGAGVDAYILDTGIYCENDEFTKKKTGTCKFGYSSVKKSGTTDTTDGNGHGTHCAGTVAGQTYGIAKEANLIAVKVMSDAGSGSSAGIIAGIDWVVGQVKSTKKPSVANMSLGGSYSEDENAAVEAAVDAGIVFVVAAGNDGKDACKYSPASAPSVITVAASEKSNKRASYSNYGSCVDIFGPGTDITSAWIDSPSATKTISGTSMASPHLCGVAAVYLSANKNQTPEEVTKKILENATPNQITDVKGSPNLVAYSAC